MIEKFFDYLFSKGTGGGPPDAFWDSVKLIHTEELRSWVRFKEYRDHDSATTFGAYRKEAMRLKTLRREISEILKAIARIEALDHAGLEEYETIEISVPRSLLRRTVALAVPETKHRETVVTSSEGELVDGKLVVGAGWRKKFVFLKMSCPSRVLFEEEIASNRQWLEQLSPEKKTKLHETQSSRFSQPVLFISHRWESLDHPDPKNEQLEKLRALRDCFVIYDYSSFPQKPDSETDQAALQLILQYMSHLLKNVIVLASPDYTSRGWCLYEYVISSLKRTLLCDELGNPDFVALRNWNSMSAPPLPVGSMIKGHSIESSIQNGIDEAILNTVNKILPMYRNSLFTVPTDRELVTKLLIEQLQATLPPKKEYVPYVSEWQTTSWTPEELATAFSDELRWEPLHSAELVPYQLDLPKTISDAVERQYKIPTAPPPNSMTAITMMIESWTFKLFGKHR